MSHNPRQPTPRARRQATPRKPSTAQRIATNARKRNWAPSDLIPPAPLNVSATKGRGVINIVWAASPDASGYQVEYLPAGNPIWHPLANVGEMMPGAGVPTNYQHTTATIGETYTYRVIATNSQGTSAPSQPSNSVLF